MLGSWGVAELEMYAEKKQIDGQYHGNRGALFSLAFITSILTAVTIGVYRFWAKTRVRKYIWSSISGDGDAFEYTGTGIEKFLGFLVAIVILAIYLGIIQMILFYFGLTLFSEPESYAQQFTQVIAFYITFLAVVPLIFFAQYRARRYKLARTRWRGVRFGAEKGAWGYVWRAIAHWMLTIVTLGALLPRQTYWLTKYKTDRSWFGDGQFELNGKWTGLYPAMIQLFIAIVIIIAGGLMIGASVSEVSEMADDDIDGYAVSAVLIGGLVLSLGFIWFMVGLVSYRVRSFEYFANHTVLDGAITFQAYPVTGTVVTTIIAGGLAASVLSGIAISIVIGVTGMFWAMTGAVTGGAAFEPGISQVIGVILFIALYIGALALSGGLMLVLVTQPVIQHIVRTISVHNTQALTGIKQRATDTGADAEGFADALDIGGAI